MVRTELQLEIIKLTIKRDTRSVLTTKSVCKQFKRIFFRDSEKESEEEEVEEEIEEKKDNTSEEEGKKVDHVSKKGFPYSVPPILIITSIIILQ